MSRRVANRVLLIGWEGVDWGTFQSPIEQGFMPTLGKLIKGSVCGNLATVQPVLSPMIWNTIATGKRADKHGICGYAELTPDRSAVRPVGTASRTCKAIWNILSQAGMTSNVVSWPASHPAENIRGAIVSDHFAVPLQNPQAQSSLSEGTICPLALAEQLNPLVVKSSEIDRNILLSLLSQSGNFNFEHEVRHHHLADLLAKTSSVHAAVCHLLERQPGDFMAVHYGAVGELIRNCLSIQAENQNDSPESDLSTKKILLNGFYQFLDLLLHKLLELAGSDTVVMLVGVNSFQPELQPSSKSGWSEYVHDRPNFGMVCINGPCIRKKGGGLYGATALDVTPTILSMLGLPYGSDMDGRSWDEILEDGTAFSKKTRSWEPVRDNANSRSTKSLEDCEVDQELTLQAVDSSHLKLSPKFENSSVNQILTNHKLNLAIALSDSNRAAQAVSLWKELVAEHPDVPRFTVQLASCCMRLEQWGECKKALSHAREEIKQSPLIRLMLAEITFNEGDSSQSAKLALKIGEQFPHDFRILNRIGHLMLKTESWVKAEAFFCKSLALNERNPTACEGLAKVYLELNSFDKALKEAKRAIALVYHFPSAHFLAGEALHYAKKEKEAIVAFETCLSMGYQVEETHGRLAGLYLLRDSVKAMEHRKQAGLF